MATLDELNKSNFIDTTQGKVVEPVKGSVNFRPTLAETDPAFMPSSSTAPAQSNTTNRTPTIEGSPKDYKDSRPQPSIKVVSAKFDPNSATEFDINTLEKRHTEPTEADIELMSDLDKAVEREKKSISERINALTEKQHEEFLAAKKIAEDKDIDSEIGIDVSDYTDDDFDSTTFTEEGDYSYLDGSSDTDDSTTPTVVLHSDTKREEEVETTSENNIDDEIGDFKGPDLELDLETEASTINENLSSIDIADDIDKDLAEEIGESPEPDTDEIMKEFSKKVKERINPITKKINLSDFKIGNKVSDTVASILSFSKTSTADHFLPNAGKVISCSALSGSELMAINPENSNRNRINTMLDIFKIIYRHIVSPKPNKFEDWMKTTLFSDLDHIYFCLYKATFAGSHFMHFECPNEKCKEVFIKDIPFEDLIVYPDDETKDRMEKILTSGDSTPPDYQIHMYQISDDYVVGLRNPSIYNVNIEVATLSNQFLTKYSDLMDFIIYIDSVYCINYTNQTLDPIDLRPEKGNMSKTIAHKIHILSKILRKLPSDNYYELRKHITELYPNMNTVTYHIPETVCDKCGTKIPAVPVEAQALLFMRHQLGAFVVL